MQGISRMMCRHRRRNHRRERIKKMLCIFGVILCMLLLYNLSNPKTEVIGTNTYFIKTGDTLWSIADENTSENIDKRNYLDIVYCLNEGLTPDIKCGQAIVLPILNKN